MSDDDVRLRVQRGDIDGATTVAIREYGPELLGYLHAIARDEALAHDAFALACEGLWKSLPTFRWESSLRTWAYSIVRRSLAQVARSTRRASNQLPASMLDSIAEIRRSTTEAYRRTSVKDVFRELRSSLDPLDHEVLVLRLDRGMSWKDIARATLDTEEDVNLVQRAAALRKRFERVKEELRELAALRGLLT